MKRLLIECAGILLFAMVIGVLVNFFRPHGIPMIGDWSKQPQQEKSAGLAVIDLDRAYAMWQSGDAVFIDARTPADFAIDHIPGAINIPRGNPHEYFTGLQLQLNPDTPVVVYCSSKDCDDSSIIADFLITNGYTNVYVYEGGIIEWDMHEYPLEQ